MNGNESTKGLLSQAELQNIVYQVDVGFGRRLIQGALLALAVASFAALFGMGTFQGLVTERSMDAAQVGRTWAETGTFGTKCLRPLALGLEADAAAARSGNVAAEADAAVADGDGATAAEGAEAEAAAASEPLACVHPEVTMGPVWPGVLALWFKVFGAPVATNQNEPLTYSGDYVPLALNLFFLCLAAWVAGRIAARLFDWRVGLLTTAAFALSSATWRVGVASEEWGLATFLGLCAVWAAVAAASPRAQGEGLRFGRGLGLVALAGLLTGAAFLTRYSTGYVAVLVALFIGCSRLPRRGLLVCAYLLVAAGAVAPWLWRNVQVCGHMFGLLPFMMLDGTHLYDGGVLLRSTAADLPSLASLYYAVQLKAIANLRATAAGLSGLGSTGVFLALAVSTLLHRFNRPTSRTLRWCALGAAASLALGASLFGPECLRALLILWPVAIAYGAAALLLAIDRLQLESRLLIALPVVAALLVTAFSSVLMMLPPRTGGTYPPYFHRYVGWAGHWLEKDEWVATDMPWATAWYADRTSVLLPKGMDDFYELHAKHPISMVYLTLLTLNKPWMRDLMRKDAVEGDWYRVLSEGRVPSDFPLQHGNFIVGGDQYVLMAEPRWAGR